MYQSYFHIILCIVSHNFVFIIYYGKIQIKKIRKYTNNIKKYFIKM